MGTLLSDDTLKFTLFVRCKYKYNLLNKTSFAIHVHSQLSWGPAMRRPFPLNTLILKSLVIQSNDIQKLIEDPKGAAMNFVYGQLASVKTQALDFFKDRFNFF